MNSRLKQISWLVLFSIAMGFLETAVVAYLRYLYYPGGFKFPLTAMDPQVVNIEVLREAATVVMLAGVGILAGRSAQQRFAFFLIAFAVWDLFYYVFLKILLDWPDSLLTWDILFLIPVPWVGPVLAPCLVCVTMILLAGALYSRDVQDSSIRINLLEWSLLISGSLTILLSWTWDYFFQYSNHGVISVDKSILFFSSYVPGAYNWWIFFFGECLLTSAILLFLVRTRRQ